MNELLSNNSFTWVNIKLSYLDIKEKMVKFTFMGFSYLDSIDGYPICTIFYSITEIRKFKIENILNGDIPNKKLENLFNEYGSHIEIR